MLEAFQLTFADWGLIFLCALLIGMSKIGLSVVSMVVIPILAIIFGGKQSTGILLPMLILSDVFGVTYYSKHATWKHVLKAFPWVVLGVLIAMLVGNVIDDKQFKMLIAVVVFVSIFLMILRDRKNADKSILHISRLLHLWA